MPFPQRAVPGGAMSYLEIHAITTASRRDVRSKLKCFSEFVAGLSVGIVSDDIPALPIALKSFKGYLIALNLRAIR
eukprot:1100603-Lingulodinium_polyedra.AAC.1